MICSLHFKETDFFHESQDTNLNRPSRLKPLTKKYLKPTATPSIFPNLPKYLSKSTKLSRSGGASSTQRRKNEAARLDEMSNDFLSSDQVKDLNDLKSKLDTKCIPEGFEFVFQHNRAMFIYLVTHPTYGPKVSASMIVHQDLKVQMFVEELEVAVSDIRHINGKLQRKNYVQIKTSCSFFYRPWTDNFLFSSYEYLGFSKEQITGWSKSGAEPTGALRQTS